MDLLENPLVQKYFGDNIPDDNGDMAMRILRAMEEPIKKGEKVLRLEYHGNWNEILADFDHRGFFHGDYLRLPDRFQKQECRHCKDCIAGPSHICCVCHETIKPTPEPEKCPTPETCRTCPKDEVEEKINEIMDHVHRAEGFENNLRALVELARKGIFRAHCEEHDCYIEECRNKTHNK